MDRELAQCLEGMFAEELAAFVDAWSVTNPDLPAAAESCGGGWMVFTGEGSPVTQAVGLGMAGPVGGAELDRLELFFGARGSTARVSLCPYADGELVTALAARGFVIEEFENIMVRRLDRADAVGHGSTVPPPLEIRAVGGEDAEAWRHVIARGMRTLGPADPVPALETALCDSFLRLRGTTCYLAWVEGVPVGGDCLAVHGDVASLFGSATLPAARRRGVQRALLAAHMQTAASLGCRLMVAGAAPGGVSQRNMERLGFAVAYTDVVVRTPSLA